MNPSTTTPHARTDFEVISLVGLAHGTSHFFHLLLPPLFPWLMSEFALSFTQAGALMTVFFTISGLGQAASGFVVDRLGAQRVLWAGIALFALSGVVLGLANSYAMLMLAAGLAGLGNCVFHPADFTILNRHVSPARLGHAFSVHGLSGNLGWAAAPVFLTTIASATNWRVAAFAASGVALAALALLIVRRGAIADLDAAHAARPKSVEAGGSTFAFLHSGAVWLCFAFFIVSTAAFGAIQNYSPSVLNQLYGLSLAVGASALTGYLLGGAVGIVVGGFLAAKKQAHERIIALVLASAAGLSLLLASGVLPSWSVITFMALIGFSAGIAGPSRDLLVRKAATSRFGPTSYGRVYGFVYSGLDIGLAVAPLIFGPLMDASLFGTVLVGVALLQGLAALTALRVRRNVPTY